MDEQQFSELKAVLEAIDDHLVAILDTMSELRLGESRIIDAVNSVKDAVSR